MKKVSERIILSIAILFCIVNRISGQNIAGIINNYARVNFITANQFVVGNTAGFNVGDKVLLIQMKGATISTANNFQFGNITALNSAGLFEFLTISSIQVGSPGLINTTANPVNSYNVNTGMLQMVRVPSYCNATVTNTLTCSLWSDVTSTGGVLAFEANVLTLNSDIDVSGKAFRGGQIRAANFGCNDGNFVGNFFTGVAGEKGEGIAAYLPGMRGYKGKQSNGGGSSNRGNCGAGGGGNGGQGGLGGNEATQCPQLDNGIGGLSLPASITRLFAGGGGGGGYDDNNRTATPGAAGGGIVYIKANTIICNNRVIQSNGNSVTVIAIDEGAGGGGAGGTIFIECGNLVGNLNVNLKGGQGGSNNNNMFATGCHGPGGGGGGGIFAYSGGTLPANVNLNLAGGGPGIVLNPLSACFNTSFGALAGTAGVSLGSLPTPYAATMAVAGPTLYCANGGGPVTLTPSNPLTGATYFWLPVNQTGSAINVAPNTTTTYTLITTLPGTSCTISAVHQVSVTNQCCPQSSLPGYNTLTSSIINTGSNLSGQIIITQNTTIGNASPGIVNFSNGEFLIAPGVQLNVVPGVVLRFSQAHIYSCGTEMWQGISIQSGGNLICDPIGTLPTFIEDAIVAIDASNLNANCLNPLLEIYNTIFNKNKTSIRVANGAQTSLDLIVRSTVFTCRNLPFTSGSWPSVSNAAGGLRFASTPTTGLSSPFAVQNYAPVNLKVPFNTQPSEIGVEISNVGNFSGQAPIPGINFGATNNMQLNYFNLFDGLGVGIKLTDASMRTMNNVFQNIRAFPINNVLFGGQGIVNEVSQGNTFNSSLLLSPVGLNQQSIDWGNRFWNCDAGIKCNNTYEVEVHYGVFRSTQNVQSPFQPNNSQGIDLTSNRAQLSVENCQFNNLNNGVKVNLQSGFYDFGTGLQMGSYVSSIDINSNYFGPAVLSANSISNEYFLQPILIDGLQASNLQSLNSISIVSNKINRCFNGISLRNFLNLPIVVGGNEIGLEDNAILPLTNQRGIELIDCPSKVQILRNLLYGVSTTNPLMTLVYCKDSQRMTIMCNDLADSKQGFEFDGNNSNTEWFGNTMLNHEYGLVLSNNGQIGQQGGASLPSDNQWLGTWVLPAQETWLNASNSNLSPIYVQSNLPPYYPMSNGGSTIPYNPSSLIVTTGSFNCPSVNYSSPPNWRNQLPTNITEQNVVESFRFFPNPSDGKIRIEANEPMKLLEVFDLTGNLVLSYEVNSQSANIDLGQNSGIYIVRIQSLNGTVYKKAVVIK